VKTFFNSSANERELTQIPVIVKAKHLSVCLPERQRRFLSANIMMLCFNIAHRRTGEQ
jgi:hypothetical protein